MESAIRRSHWQHNASRPVPSAASRKPGAVCSLPRDKNEWAKSKSAKPTSIHDKVLSQSGSEFGFKQFHSLKVIWPEHQRGELLEDKWSSKFGSSEAKIQRGAKAMAEQRDDWKAYLRALERPLPPPDKMIGNDIGRYTIPLRDQQTIRSRYDAEPDADKIFLQNSENSTAVSNPKASVVGESKRKETSRPKIDEETVAGAMINLLMAWLTHVDCSYGYRRKNKQFEFTSATHESYIARTDGDCRFIGDKEGNCAAIIECKGGERPTNKRRRDDTTEYQESAQMAAWIYEEPKSHWTASSSVKDEPAGTFFYRLLFAQNRNQFYIILARYQQGYIDYLHGKQRDINKAPFLEMHRFGPWDLYKKEDQRELAAVHEALIIEYVTKHLGRY